MAVNVLVFSTDLVKWSADRFTATFSINLRANEKNFSIQSDLDVKSLPEAVTKCLTDLENGTRNQLALSGKDTLELRDQEMISKSLESTIAKTQKELQQSKNGGKGKGRTAITRYNLFYLKEPEIQLLNEDERYLAYMDIIERKASKDHFNQVGTYIQEALKLRPEDGTLLMYLGRYYLSVNKVDEAIETMETYVNLNEGDIDVLTELARLCDKANDYKKADKVYNKIIKIEPENLDALARKAQFKYYKKQKFLPELDKIKKIDSDWLKEHLKKRWDYSLPEAKYGLNPIKTAKYLGFSKAVEVAAMVVRGEIPANYKEKSAQMMFCKDEIDQWYDIINRYEMNDSNVQLDKSVLV